MKNNPSKPEICLQSKIFVQSVLICCFLNAGVYANNIDVTNVKLTGQNTTSKYTIVQLDLSWENSWRTSTAPYNWDAAWVFAKYRVSVNNGGDGLWKHAWLNDAGNIAPTGSRIDIGLLAPGTVFNATTNPGLGVFIYRNSEGTGTFSITGVQLRWNYGANEVADNAVVDILVYAIEMVYVPQGAYYAGSGGTEDGSFTDGSWTSGSTIPLSISSEDELTVANTAGDLWYTDASIYIGDRAGPIPVAFPKGYNAFYCMKYELSQQGYVDFLNSLTYTQQATRTLTDPDSPAGTYLDDECRNKIKISTSGTNNTVPAIYATDYPYVACNYLSWGDLAAYFDWSGIRPMTELEFEKVCRGPLPAVANEFAWGTTGFASDEYTLNNEGLTNEVIATDYETTVGIGNAATASTVLYTLNGPVRVGIFAGTTGNNGRVTAGATYYGIMEMSGNLNESPITVGNVTGRDFTGIHGNGALNTTGDADVTAWPGTDAVGAGLRGGNWNTYAMASRVSDRANAANGIDFPDGKIGGRGVRLVTSGFISEWRTTTSNETITLPLSNGNSSAFNCIVYWGDGTSSQIMAYDDPNRIHAYATAGDYRVEILGTCEGWSFGNSGDILKIRKIIHWGDSDDFNGFKYLQNGFYGCSNLSTLADGGMLASGIGCTGSGFANTFRGCTSLTSIPSDLFKYHTSVSSGFGAGAFYATFQDCSSLALVPKDLFRYNTAVSTWGFCRTFWGCSSLNSIPIDLFRYNTAVSGLGFNLTFGGCSSLTSIPADLFRYNVAVSGLGFEQTFYGCSSLTSIPTDLFRYNTVVSSYGFSNTFSGCSSLTSIPTDLFRYNTAVTMFDGAFNGCTSLTSVPAYLFRYNTAVSTGGFYRTFYGCTKLQLNRNIFFADGEESTRFFNQTVSFIECFYRDSFSGMQGEAPPLWNCSFGTGTPYKTSCYGGAGNSATSLINYSSIPADWE